MRSNFSSLPEVDYKPKNIMAKPEKQIVPPAIACVYLSNLPNLANPMLHDDSRTITSIVLKVVIVNIPTTRTIPEILLFAAGYMSNGIRGSQGPSTKTVNKIQGVMSLAVDLWSCTCACSEVCNVDDHAPGQFHANVHGYVFYF